MQESNFKVQVLESGYIAIWSIFQPLFFRKLIMLDVNSGYAIENGFKLSSHGKCIKLQSSFVDSKTILAS